MPALHIQFEAGTTGEVEFVCPYLRLHTPSGEVLPSFSQIEPIVADEITVELPSGLDPDVTPNPWSYTVKLRLNDEEEYLTFITMPMDDAEFEDLVHLAQPVTPEYFVLKSVYDAHLDEGGGGGGVTDHGDLDGLGDDDHTQYHTDERGDVRYYTKAQTDSAIDADIATHEGAANPHPVYLTQAEADPLYETDGAVAAHTAATDPHGDRAFATAAVTTHSGATDPHGDRAFTTAAIGTHAGATDPHGDRNYTDTAVATETSARITDVNAEESRALAAEALLAPLADPALTGNPTAPTQTVGNNSTRLATTAFVQTASGLLVPKSLFTGKGVLAIATAADTPAAHAAPTTGQFLVGDTAQADGWTNRALTYTDLPALPRCTVSGTAQTITTGSGGEILNTNVTESIDTHGFHSDVTNPSRMTIPSGLGGTYLIMPKVSWQSQASASGYRRLNVFVNGTTTETVYVIFPPSNTAVNFGLTLLRSFVAGDYLELEAIHTQGSDITATMSEWTIIRIGP